MFFEWMKKDNNKCREKGLMSGEIRRQLMSINNERREFVEFGRQMMGFAMWDARFDKLHYQIGTLHYCGKVNRYGFILNGVDMGTEIGWTKAVRNTASTFKSIKADMING